MVLADDDKSKSDVDNTQSARFPPLSPKLTARISASESVFSLQCRLIRSVIRPDFRRFCRECDCQRPGTATRLGNHRGRPPGQAGSFAAAGGGGSEPGTSPPAAAQ